LAATPAILAEARGPSVRIRFAVRQLFPEGGLTLAVFRLAQALHEMGHDAGVLFGEGEPPVEAQWLAQKADGLLAPDDARAVQRALEREAPDLILVCEDSPEWLQAAAATAPTVLHAHMHWGVCADAARYWHRLARPCSVRAGSQCVALRPLLGCSGFDRARDPRFVGRQRRLLAQLGDGVVGVVSVSTDQAELYAAHGVPPSRVATVPNLGIRMSADELFQAALETPEAWRGAVAFFGRLTKAKGAGLLAAIASALPRTAPLRIFGEGYLAADLRRRLASDLCGRIRQREVAGVMMWARAVVFPSLWPEPGGIAGIDAQIMGVPLAAFDVGAARHWPSATFFSHRDLRSMAEWLARQHAPSVPRDAVAVSALQAAYWERVACHAATAFDAFVARGSFPHGGIGASAETLMAATAAQRPGSTPTK
jgi:glycosyltransferase involved in cell wall biosynthesis